MQTINPATGHVLRDYPETSPKETEEILRQSFEVFQEWRTVSHAERADKMKRVAEILRRNTDEYAVLMAQEMGKPVRQGRAEIEKCAWVCDFYAESGAKFLSPEPAQADAAKSYVSFEPLGPVLAIMPWNFPFWQVFRAAAPALMAGNTLVLKHASSVTGSALVIERIFIEAGFPEGLLKVVVKDNRAMEDLIRHPLIRGVTLTGSVRAGKAVASAAGAALKKTVLELGGSDAYLILEDADLQEAARTCAYARMINSGQSCIAAKRFIVAERAREAFEEKLTDALRLEKTGDPLDEETTVGPLARYDLRDELHRQVMTSVEKGAKVLLGGSIPEMKGAFYPPTVLTNVKKGMPVFNEETFGPVAAVISARDEEEAIQLANDSVFGLGGAVFTSDKEKGEAIAKDRLEAGACFVNTHVRSDPRLPFGGIKESGYGRELGVYGMREFVNIKTVYVK